MPIQQIKIFGERNTGTNWIEEILLKNYDIRLVHHRGIINAHITDFQREVMRQFQGTTKRLFRERLIDGIFNHEAPDLFGWKHTCVTEERLRQSANFEHTGFIFLVKHPYTYIKSLHKKPYHAILESPDNVDDFITSPWLTVQREHVDNTLLNTPLELWNYKVRSYIDFVNNSNGGLLLRYEDLLENFESLFDRIEEEFGVKAQSRLPIEQSTKSDTLSTSDYKKKYLNADPSEGFKPASIDFMRTTLDRRIIDYCGYDI